MVLYQTIDIYQIINLLSNLFGIQYYRFDCLIRRPQCRACKHASRAVFCLDKPLKQLHTQWNPNGQFFQAQAQAGAPESTPKASILGCNRRCPQKLTLVYSGMTALALETLFPQEKWPWYAGTLQQLVHAKDRTEKTGSRQRVVTETDITLVPCHSAQAPPLAKLNENKKRKCYMWRSTWQKVTHKPESGWN